MALTKEENEKIAFDVLREMITRARNNVPYEHLLPLLKDKLKDAPDLRKAIEKICVDFSKG